MIADLHAHYPTHLEPDTRATIALAKTARGRPRRRDRARATVVGALSRLARYESLGSGPRVTVGSLREGGVEVVLSVLYSPFDEIDLDRPYGAPPEPRYIDSLIAQADLVERDLAVNHASSSDLVRSAPELDAALRQGKIAFVHCVEGGFHLGPTPDAVEESVRRLARRGVGYVTIAHLFWRCVSTNAPAIPFLPDWLYRLTFPQPDQGLTELGRAAVRAMVRERVLVDVAHMSRRALEEALTLLDELDPAQTVPVIASHAGCAFGPHEYMLDERALRRIAARDGVVGLIFAEHQILDGVRRSSPKTFDESFEVLCRHIDQIAEIAGSHRHAAIGSDLDGFIQPTLAGLQTMADMKRLEAALVGRYGPADAELISSANALRPLRTYWGANGSGT